MSDDRTVHANLANGGQVVRYDRAGKWYREGAGGRVLITAGQAALLAAAPDSVWFARKPGGQFFDAQVRKIVARR